jgi:hypothetical protein
VANQLAVGALRTRNLASIRNVKSQVFERAMAGNWRPV